MFSTTSWCVPCFLRHPGVYHVKYNYTWYKSGTMAGHALCTLCSYTHILRIEFLKKTGVSGGGGGGQSGMGLDDHR